MREAATPALLPATLGISWFWFLGATYLAQFPNMAKTALNANEDVVVFFLVTFVVGIAVGALASNLVVSRLVRAGLPGTGAVPFMAVALGVLSVEIWFTLSGMVRPAALIDLPAFLADPAAWRLAVDLFLLAVAGGLFVVPLYALLQARSPADRRARTIAALNVMNSLFMVLSALAGMAVFAAGYGVADLLAGAGILGLGLAVYLRHRLKGGQSLPE